MATSMSACSHGLTCFPLPPGRRHPGTGLKCRDVCTSDSLFKPTLRSAGARCQYRDLGGDRHRGGDREKQSERGSDEIKAMPAPGLQELTPSTGGHDELLGRCANAVRLLAVDAVNNVNAGHPGSAMGLAPLGVLLFSEIMRFSPRNPAWPNRDRFVLSNGHACLLQYTLLHLTGYDVQMEDLKRLCRVGSKTPGHPENHVTPGIEVVTGPLGQGFANAVGLAVAESHQAARFNTHHHRIFDHYTYVVFGDGCAMEGITNEAASLAGHWGLGKLVAFYDSNRVTIDGMTSLAFSEDVMGRYAALGWHVQHVSLEHNDDFHALRRAINAAKLETNRPSLIQLDTCIGFGSPSKEGTPKAHHGAFGPEEAQLIRRRLQRDEHEAPFTVPEDVSRFMGGAVRRGEVEEAAWNHTVDQFLQCHPNRRGDLEEALERKLPPGWEKLLPSWTGEESPDATRGYSERCLNSLASGVRGLLGGSADLASSNKTYLREERDYSRDCREGRNIRFGVREHSMAAISTGLALHGSGLIPFVSTFLVFSDYMRPAMRLSALSGAGVIFVFTHDSIGLGEDGPTHQPVEHLPSLRAMPNLLVLRPGDGTETAGAYRVAVARRDGPSAIVLSRQKLCSNLEGSSAEAVARGAYILWDCPGTKESGQPDIILLSSGSELPLCQQAARKLHENGIPTRVVSMVCWELFRAQPREYRDSVIPPHVPLRLAVEAASSLGWAEWLGPQGQMVSVDKFGMSGQYSDVLKEYGFTLENVVRRSFKLLERD